eukprot:TRINITY_DN3059_c3_g1_i1.p1 TRINITY_DN3059_c3_g1~~TRINITY_DN3059_c3_g1_i1.p1  ORF type:complete len:206 (-),score=61.49 TRINITY_DN3059_c3_g1_i1:293-910(-)
MSDEYTLPKATVSKIVKEVLPKEIRCATDSRDLIVDCCVEFVHLISSEANHICTKENKRTIAPEHIIQSLTELGFESYLEEVNQAWDKHKVQAHEKQKKGIQRKLAMNEMSVEERKQKQRELFAKARTEYHRTSQQNISLSSSSNIINTSPSNNNNNEMTDEENHSIENKQISTTPSEENSSATTNLNFSSDSLNIQNNNGNPPI